MRSHRHHFALFRRRSIVRCLVLLLIFFPVACYAKVKRAAAAPPDAPSGFFPGLINYFAGNGTTQGSYADGSVPTQVPIEPVGAVASDSLGNIYVASNASIYMVYAGGSVPATLANVTINASPAAAPIAGRIYQIAGLAQTTCQNDSDPTCGEGLPLNQAVFGGITGLALDSAGNLYICDDASFVIRESSALTSNVKTIAGQLNVEAAPPEIGDGGPATSATLNFPYDVGLDAAGNVYINDLDDAVVRVVYSGSAAPVVLAAEGVTPAAGYIYTIAGQAGTYCSAVDACGDGEPANGPNAYLVGPNSVAIDAAGNVYIADAYSGGAPNAAYIRIVYAGGTVPPLLDLYLNPGGGNTVTPTAGDIYPATGYGAATEYVNCTLTPCGDGGTAANVEFGATSNYLSIFLDSGNNLYIADLGDFAVRKIDSSGYASAIAGIDDPNQVPPAALSSPGGAATATQLSNNLTSIVFDSGNNLYIGDNAQDLVWIVASLQPQIITFPSFEQAVTYGANSIPLTATASSGLPVAYGVSGPAQITGSDLIVNGAGAVAVTASQAGNSQYGAATPVTQSLTVNPASLTVMANSASRLPNQPNPAFTANYSGFVNGDIVANSITGQPAFSTTATSASGPGSYPLTISQGSLTSSKYTFDFVQGATLTITGTELQKITFSQPAGVTYGQSPTVTLAASASSGLPVQFTVVSGPATNVAGGATLTIKGAERSSSQLPRRVTTPIRERRRSLNR